MLLSLGSGARADQFLLFGEGGKYFAAHISDGQVNYNEVVSIEQPYTFKDGVCHKRFCPGPDEVLVPDSQLPQLVNQDGFPIENKEMGEFNGTLAHVKKVLYADGQKAQ